jgi:prefoldin subunit 5
MAEMAERVATLEAEVKHLNSSMGMLQASHEKLVSKVDAIDKRILVMVTGAAGVGTGIVQAVLHLLGVK